MWTRRPWTGTATSPSWSSSQAATSVVLLDAVVLTGGEPTLQPEACRAISELVKGMGLKVMLYTNGSRPQVTEALIEAELVDRVVPDVKDPLNPEENSGGPARAGLFSGHRGGLSGLESFGPLRDARAGRG